MAISNLTVYTGNVPLIGQTQIEFDTNTGNILGYLNSFGTDLNARVGEINTTASTINTLNTNVNNKHLDVVNKTAEAALSATEATTAKTAIQSYVVPTDAVDSQTVRNAKDKLINKANFIANGHTAEPKEYIETNTPYTMIDPSTDSLIVDGNVVEVVGEELVVNGDFNDGTDGWTSISGGTLSEVNGKLRVTSTGIAYQGAEQVFSNIIAGNMYVLRIDKFSIDARVDFEGIVDLGGVLKDLGDGRYYVIPTTNYLHIVLYNKLSTAGAFVEFDNISVKEIKPIKLPLAPFDPVSTDEVLDDSVNGLNTQMAHNKGDIVVAGAELVTNGTFDTDTNWTKAAGVTISTGIATATAVTAGINAVTQSLTGLVIGKEYTVKFEITNLTAGGLGIYLVTHVPVVYNTEIGVYTASFTATAISDTINIRTGIALTTASFDNISVTLKDDVYLASVDTVDMYDYTTDDGTQTVNDGDIVKYITPAGSGGVDGHYYMRTGGAFTLDLATVGFTTGWIDLGTASTMSLQNPYFKVLPRVARQDVVCHRVNKATLAYDKHSFKGTHLFEDTADSIEIMDYYFGSPDSIGLWSDATYWYLPLDCFERFNAGAYHPWFNELGISTWQNEAEAGNRLWYHSDFSGKDMLHINAFRKLSGVISSYGTGHIGTTVLGRPNAEFYNKVYKNQSRDLRLKAYEEDDTTLLRKKASENESGRLDGVEGVVECKYVHLGVSTSVSASGFYMYFTPDYDIFPDTGVTSTVDGWYGSVVYNGVYYVDVPVYKYSATQYGIGIGIATTSGIAFSGLKITRKSPHSFRSEYTMTDLIGSPENYPSSLKSRLASGKGVLINPLLISDEGDDLIPDGTSKSFKTSEKLISFESGLYSSDNGDTWGDNTSAVAGAFDLVNNNHSVTIVEAQIRLYQYQAKTNSTKSLPIGTTEATLDKFYASNSHSIYKGGTAVASGTGKIPTGNGSNGFESGYLGDCEVVLGKDEINVGTIINAYVDDVYLIKGDGGLTDTPSFGRLYKRINSDLLAYTVVTTTGFSASANWEEVYETTQTHIGSTPSHQTINLDTEDSIASKRFYTLEVDSNNQKQLVQYTTEVAYNSLTTSYDGDSELFSKLTDGTITDDNAKVCITSRTARKLNSFKGE